MALNEVYITNTAHYFPNGPISNDEMEEYLGLINKQPSKSRRIVLRNNGIKRRFYALTREGQPTHTNAQMAALAVRALFDNDPQKLAEMQLLSCGTSSPDQLMPSHAVMVHGWLPESRPIEVVSPSGVCCAGMHAFKYAYMSVKTGEVNTAVATGSERLSRILRSDVFEDEVHKLTELEQNPFISFEKEFLRWMLSDGAAAWLLSSKPATDGVSLKVEWVEGVSFANTMEACMYMGSEKMEDGTLKSYMDYSPEEIMNQSILSIKQDVKLLGEYIVNLGIDKMQEVFERRGFSAAEVDYFLPHISSDFFKNKIADKLKQNGMEIPEEKWVLNLSQVGNVGAGSIYMMLDELFHSNRLQHGQKIILSVPESSRFSYVYALLTVVGR
jgi:3-oxoacyl-[acyl-carrier-protein] synthase-3